MNDSLLIFLAVMVPALLIVNIILTLTIRRSGRGSEDIAALKADIAAEMRATRQEMAQSVQGSVSALGVQLSDSQRQGLEAQSRSIAQLSEQLLSHNRRTDARLESMSETIEKRLTAIQADNTKQLDQMRQVVDEKLQTTLNERLTQSFSQVSERLEQVYKGLGEMQTLATGVGDLKKILANVKTRGILGEIQLGAILEQMLSPEQYGSQVRLKPDSYEHVDYAIRLPGEGDAPVWLPIDAKFPADLYANLSDAYDAGDKDAIDAAGKLLEQRIKTEAKTIREKYIAPPHTTDFAVMFLPVEGLYAEVVRRGLVELLQRDYKVTIAGPTTMAALLNALQMGFRTLAIQKRSGEVWELLGAVKTEFVKFADILEKARERLRLADQDLHSLIGVRTRAIQRRLRDVTALPEIQAVSLIGDSDPVEADAAEID